MSPIFTWLREVSTEADNRTPDFLRIIACVGVTVFLVLSCWDVFVLKTAFNAISFGTGFGAVLLAAGGAVRLNEGPATPPAGPTTNIETSNVTVKA
jgi:hypothetical protein